MAVQPAIRVLVVDDSAFMRKVISSMLNGADGIEVVGTAGDGLDAIKQTEQLKPDAITLDVEMPNMDGLTALRQIKRISAAPVLMISSITTEGSFATLAALRAGATDFIAKDSSQISLGITRIEDELIAKIRAVVGAGRARTARGSAPVLRPTSVDLPQLRSRDYDLITIGSSTGGPPVLETILTALPADMRQPIIIAQHMPRLFTESLATRLDELCAVTVLHGENGLPLLSGQVYVGPGGQHVRARRAALGKYRLEVSAEPADALYKPSVNELFSSAGHAFGRRVLAVVLTGMGDDGLLGSRDLSHKQATILAQEHSSCAVYGMPKVVTQAGLVAANLTPDQLGAALASLSPSAVAARVA